MPYNKTTWNEGAAPGISAARLNNIEQGIYDAHARMDEAAEIPVTIKRGLNVVQSSQASGAKVKVLGCTRCNILGKDGGCESLAPFTVTGTAPSLSTSQKRSGSNSIRFAPVASNSYLYKDYNYSLDPAKQYFVGAWVYLESFSGGSPTISLRDYGSLVHRYSASPTTAIGVWQFIYFKVPVSNTLVGSGFRLLFGVTGTADCVAYFDDIRIFELSTPDYNAIGMTYATGDQIDAFLPYVDGVKHLQGVAVRKQGKNLYDGVGDTTAGGGTYVQDQNNNITATSDGGAAVRYLSTRRYEVVPNTVYTLSFTGTNVSGPDLPSIRIQGMGIAAEGVGRRSLTFNSGANTALVFYVYSSYSTAAVQTKRYEDIQLELGSVATAYTPYNADYINVSTILASNVDRSIADSYDSDSGKVFRRWRTGQLLDGTLPWTYHSSQTGFKRVQLTSLFPTINGGAVSEGYDGRALKITTVTPTSPNEVTWLAAFQSITVSTSESGWNDALNPSPNAIKALMNGWKATANNGTSYNAWASILDGSLPTTNTEAWCAANKASGWTGWATLDYVLAQPYEEPLIGDTGAIGLHAGANQIELLEGVVVREKAKPVRNDGQTLYFINQNLNYPASNLSKRAAQILAVFKNNVKDSKWTIYTGSQGYGASFAQINATDFDPAAEYFVTYIVLDKYAYSANAIDATLTFQSTLGGTVAKNTQDIADLKTNDHIQDFALDYIEAKTDNVRIDFDGHAAATDVHGATSAATANRLMLRDAAGRSKAVAPSASDDVAIKATVDTHAALTAPHSATSAATASRLVLRDAAGRAQFSDPAAAQDAATKAYVDARFVSGSYTGNGASTRTISLPFTPSAVLVVSKLGEMRNAASNMYGGLAVTGSDVESSSGNQIVISITTNGFVLSQGINNAAANQSSMVYHYIAFK